MRADVWLINARQKIDYLDASLLLRHVLNCSRAALMAHPETELTEAQLACLDRLLTRRATGEPLAYLTESAWFYGRNFRVTPAVLTPRPETEELAERALRWLAEANFPAPRVLDLGTGSGVLAVTIALECPAARVTAVDCAPDALDCARANAEFWRVSARFLLSDWFSGLAGERFHLVVANPPYLAAHDPHLFGDGVRYEPRGALVGGEDGLEDVRRILRFLPGYLEPGGFFLCEHGYEQGAAVRALLIASGFEQVQTWRDLSGQERMSGGVFKKQRCCAREFCPVKSSFVVF
ncbi:MAG: peptide chain release factor N(5)-glutamine methyltransferase [Zoogloeaceae bacterium]|nr:peptide chain release factor N(5)-glutamine methyltransferase [Zoogloeaceae bacterium]